MSPRLCKDIYAQQVNCVTDVGCCHLPLLLVASSISPEGQFWLHKRFAAVCYVQSQIPYVFASISSSAHVMNHRQSFCRIELCLAPVYCVQRERSLGSSLKSVLATVEEMQSSVERAQPLLAAFWGSSRLGTLPWRSLLVQTNRLSIQLHQARSRLSHDCKNLPWSTEELFTVRERSTAGTSCRCVNIMSKSVDSQDSLLGSFPNVESPRRERRCFWHPLVRGSCQQVACATPKTEKCNELGTVELDGAIRRNKSCRSSVLVSALY